MPMSTFGFPVMVSGQVPLTLPPEHRATISSAGNKYDGVNIQNGPGGPYNTQQVQQTTQPANWPSGAQIAGNDGLVFTKRVNTSFINMQKIFGQMMGRIRKIPDGDYVQGYQEDTSRPDFYRNREAFWQPDGPAVPPRNIIRPMQSDIGSWNGIQQHGFAQTFGGMTDTGAWPDASGGAVWPPPPGAGFDGRSLILTPAFIPRPTTTGIRSISGVTARARYGQASNRRIPAVFVPVQV